MRHSCLFVAISLALLTLSGCRVESGGSDDSSAFNPADDVDLTFRTFDLTDTEQAPDTLSFTRFSDFYPGIEPAGNDDTAGNQQLVESIRRHIDQFIGAQPTDDGKAYTQVRNPLDLMNQVISVGRVDNFDEGRRYIRERIASGEAGNYNTRSAGAIIRFTDQDAVANQEALNNRQWFYQTLDWRYQPPAENLDGKVYRVIQYVARNVEETEREQQPQLLSLLSGSRFNANEFSNLGYNQPEFATVDYVSRSYGGIELRQEFAAEAQKDTLYIKSPDQQILDLGSYQSADADPSPDCIRVELNYAMSEVRLYTSNNEPARIPDPQADPADYPTEEDIPRVPNENNCTYQPADQAITFWSAESAANRQ